MNTMKRLTSLLLAVCMLVAILPAGMFTASAAGESYVYDFAGALQTESDKNLADSMIILHKNSYAEGDVCNTTFDTFKYWLEGNVQWRFAREKTNAGLVQHNGAGTQANIDYGIFMFEYNDHAGKYASFEIEVPTSGTYTFTLNYHTIGTSRPVDVYLTPSADSANVMDVQNKVLSIADPSTYDQDVPASAHNVPIGKGKYYLTICTSGAGSTNNDRYFLLKKLTLTKTSDTVTAASKIIIHRSSFTKLTTSAPGNTVSLSTVVFPTKLKDSSGSMQGFADQTVTWASSNPTIASVNSTTGLVTGLKEGTAIITATSLDGKICEAVSVLVGDSKSQFYAVNEDGKYFMYVTKVFGNTTSLTVSTAQHNLNDADSNKGTDFAKDYTYAKFDKWCYASELGNHAMYYYLSSHTDKNASKLGAHLRYETSGNAVTLKIKVEQDGNYIPEISYFTTNLSKNADVYIYPVHYVTNAQPLLPAECKVMTLKTNTAKYEHTRGSEIALRKGEYYITFNNATMSNANYVHLHHIALLYQKEYSNSVKATKILLPTIDPKFTPGEKLQLTGTVFPKNADPVIEWSYSMPQSHYVSAKDGLIVPSGTLKGSNVVSAKVGEQEEVLSVSTGALLYAFNNVGKAYLAANYSADAGSLSVALDQFQDYTWHDSYPYGDKWAYVDRTDTKRLAPTVYQGNPNNYNERYGVFLDFGTADNYWERFKIHVSKTGNYFPEVMYRDNGRGNMRETTVYLTPIHATDSDKKEALTLTPAEDAPSEGRVTAARGESMYLVEGDYYLTFHAGEYTGTFDAQGNRTARYLYLYHLALVENDASAEVIAPKAVVITKDHTNPLAVDETLQLSARVVPTWAPQNVTWKSYNEDVATVDQNGVVTAKKNGVAVITATTKTDARSESVVVQVGDDTQVYAFNEVLKKYMEINDFDNETKKNSINISQEDDFTDAAYSWKDTYSVGQGWRWLGGNATASNAYTGDSKKYDTGNDDSKPNFKYGLFLLSHDIDSYARFEIDVERSGKYTAEVFQYMAKNNTDSSQSSCPVEVYISPIGTATEDLMCETYYVGTTVLKDGELHDGSYWSYGLDKQHFNADGDNRIQLKEGKYNLVFKVADNVGRYLYLHHFALHREGDYVEPATEKVQITKGGNVTDEVVYLNASNPSVTLGAMVVPYQQNPSVTWTTSDSSIATVANGVVTVSPTATRGTAIITATVGGVTDTIRVIVGTTGTYVQQFDFRGAAKGEFAAQMTNGASFNLFGTGFAAGYALSVAHGSAPWMLYDTTETEPYCHYSWGSFRNNEGLYILNSTADNAMTRFKIKVAEDANYGVVLNISDWAHSRDFEVYLAPAAATCPTDARWKVGSYSITRRKNNYYALDLGERTLYAGEYILSFKAGKVNYKGSNNGYVAIQNMSIFRTGEAFYTIEGAQVRIRGKNQFGKLEDQGLRFISTIYKSEYNVDTSAIKEFGTLLVPESMLTDTNGDGVKDGYDLIRESPNAKPVAAKNRYVDHKDYVSFTAVVTGLKAAHYKMAIVARAYVILNDGTIIYGDTWTKRSIYEVAENGLARDEAQTDENKKMGETEREALEAIITNAE